LYAGLFLGPLSNRPDCRGVWRGRWFPSVETTEVSPVKKVILAAMLAAFTAAVALPVVLGSDNAYAATKKKTSEKMKKKKPTGKM
jgi:hypothetical protein